MINKYINSIDVWHHSDGSPQYIFKGDGQGDFEHICYNVESKKILEDYVEYLDTQLDYVKNCIENYRE